MRLMRKAILPLAVLFVLLASAALSYASVITVDIAGKAAKSDTSALDPKRVRVDGDQSVVFIMNTTLVPQHFTLKFNTLSAESYDVYINDAFRWTKPAKELEDGIALDVDGRIVDNGMIRCLNATKPLIDAEQSKLSTASDPEAKRVAGTLNQAADWCNSSIQGDQVWRSVSVVLAPSGKALKNMARLKRRSDVDTARGVTRSCWLLQQARARMYHVIKDTALRNEAVIAMTPVEFTATYSTKNGKPHIDAKLINNCDLPISGDISMALPAGWKSTAKKLNFAAVKCGQTFAVSFDLVAPSKTAVAPESVPMAANVNLVQDVFTASCKLRTTAQAQPK